MSVVLDQVEKRLGQEAGLPAAVVYMVASVLIRRQIGSPAFGNMMKSMWQEDLSGMIANSETRSIMRVLHMNGIGGTPKLLKDLEKAFAPGAVISAAQGKQALAKILLDDTGLKIESLPVMQQAEIARIANRFSQGSILSNGSRVAAPKNALTPAKAFEEIDEFRRLGKGLEPLGPAVPVKGDGLGTVALAENEGRQFFGVNSSILSDASKDLGREVFKKMQQQGLLKGATAYGQGAAQVLTHAKAHSLMRMWQKLGMNMPAEVIIFVDRYTCANCQKYLGK